MAKIGSWGWEGEEKKRRDLEAADAEAIREALEVHGDEIRCPECDTVGVVMSHGYSSDLAVCRVYGCGSEWQIVFKEQG